LVYLNKDIKMFNRVAKDECYKCERQFFHTGKLLQFCIPG
jgi:hypothetical protein